MSAALTLTCPSGSVDTPHLAACLGRGESPSRMEEGDDVARWVLEARRGDRAAYASLYARFARPVHAAALSRAPAADVDDAVQETFLAAFRALETLDEPAAFGGWILQIARRTAIDHRRRARPSVELTPEAVQAAPVPRAEALEALALLKELPEAYRETLVMRLVEGMTGPEIAHTTGLTAESVRVNLCRGMKLLRDKLGLEAKP